MLSLADALVPISLCANTTGLQNGVWTGPGITAARVNVTYSILELCQPCSR